MEIITQEHLADNFIKNILAELWQDYTNDKHAHDECIMFDEYVRNRLRDLGQATYEVVGEMYGDLDGAVSEVME